MTVVVNGDRVELEPGLTIRGLLDRMGIGVGPVVVELNGEVLRRWDHRQTELQEGDVLEIAHFSGGG